MGKIILTGDRPTGRLHLGHYVGSLRRRVELQNSGLFDKIFIMIADAQALTDNADNPEKVRQNIIEVALDYLSVGIDPAKSTIFIQSQVAELCELAFYYMNLVTVSRLQRNPTVKTEIQMRNFESYKPSIGYNSVPRYNRSCRRGPTTYDRAGTRNSTPFQRNLRRDTCGARDFVARQRGLSASARHRRQGKNE